MEYGNEDGVQQPEGVRLDTAITENLTPLNFGGWGP